MWPVCVLYVCVPVIIMNINYGNFSVVTLRKIKKTLRKGGKERDSVMHIHLMMQKSLVLALSLGMRMMLKVKSCCKNRTPCPLF